MTLLSEYGRVLNEDTYEGQVTNPLSQNLYTYVGNNPLTRFDPSGHDWLDKLSGFLNAGVDAATFGGWTVVTNYLIGANNSKDYKQSYGNTLQSISDAVNALPPADAILLDFYLKGAMVSVKASTISGVTFEGTLYRSVTKGANPLEIHPGNIAANHRYTGSGTGGLYFSTGEKIVDAELNTWAVATEGRAMHAYDVKVHNLLDLSNPKVREVLGVTLDDILSNDYTITQQLGETAKSMNYNGIIAPSARADGGLNVILFDATSIK